MKILLAFLIFSCSTYPSAIKIPENEKVMTGFSLQGNFEDDIPFPIPTTSFDFRVKINSYLDCGTNISSSLYPPIFVFTPYLVGFIPINEFNSINSQVLFPILSTTNLYSESTAEDNDQSIITYSGSINYFHKINFDNDFSIGLEYDRLVYNVFNSQHENKTFPLGIVGTYGFHKKEYSMVFKAKYFYEIPFIFGFDFYFHKILIE